MSLATRCSACGTIFRVVEDQLRVSDGFVRCGRCAEVFDARAQLFDIDLEAPPPWPAEVAAAPPPAAAPAPFEVEHRPYPESGPAQPSVWPADAAHNEPRPSQFAADHSNPAVEPELDPTTGPAQELAHPAHFDARLEPHWADEAPLADQPSKPTEPASMIAGAATGPDDVSERPDVVLAEHLAKISTQQAQPPTPAVVADAAAAALPEFLRPPAAKTKWQGSRAGIALGLLAALLLSALLLQAGLHFRDTLAAVHPGLRPTLQMACALTGCEIKPRQRIEGIGVESSALNQAGSGNHYQLVVGLRNKNSTEVATPWVDVSLTDSAGALVAKRVLAPADFKTDKLAMPADSELVLQTTLSTGGARVSGYSVEIFYP